MAGCGVLVGVEDGERERDRRLASTLGVGVLKERGDSVEA